VRIRDASRFRRAPGTKAIRMAELARYAILPRLPNHSRRHIGSRHPWTIMGALPLIVKDDTSRLYFLNVFLRPYPIPAERCTETESQIRQPAVGLLLRSTNGCRL
jgi:hypothetical protein